MRCLALARALSDRGWACSLACRKGTAETISGRNDHDSELIELEGSDEPGTLAKHFASGLELLVVDHYALAADFHRCCREFSRIVLVIDELMDRQFDCDYLLDQSPGRGVDDYSGLVPAECQLLLGPRYALLRSEFRNRREQSLRRRVNLRGVNRILVNFGASDINNLTFTTLRAIQQVEFGGAVDIVLGGGACHNAKLERYAEEMNCAATVYRGIDNMAELMTQADLAIGGSGISSWERCTLALPALVVMEADNQLANVEGLKASGAAVSLGAATQLDSQAIEHKLQEILEDSTALQEMSRAASLMCDGNGVTRVMDNVIQ